MLKNYLTIALRHIRAGKAYSFINILGLAVGLAVCLVILLYIFEETSYDRQHPGADRFYRINTSFRSKTDHSQIASSNPNIAAGLRADFPEVEAVTRLLTSLPGERPILLDYDNGKGHEVFYEKLPCYVDANFFDLFSYKFLWGDAHSALLQPNTAVITDDLARQLFGNADPVGKVFQATSSGADSSCMYTIKGVVRAIGPSHIEARLFLSMDNDNVRPWLKNKTNWATHNLFLTYVRLKKGADPVAFENKLNPFLRRHGNADIEAAGAERLLSIQPVTAIHLHSSLSHDISVNSNISYLYILGSIAAFTLLIACINFMNLATARSQKRAKEVGVRKVMGALRGSLMIQFLGESLITSFIAFLLALSLVLIFLPVFNSLAQRQLRLFEYPSILGLMAGLALFTGVLAGLYPAIYLSSFRPIRVLKGQLVNSLSALFLRKGLVVFQFTIAVFLILAAMVIGQQLNFLTSRDLGFQKDQQIVIPLRTSHAAASLEALRRAEAADPNVLSTAGGTTYPGQTPFNDIRFYADNKTVAEGANIPFGRVGYDYIETMGMNILYGRAFSRDYPADSDGFIFNETAVRQLGLDPATAVGARIHYDGGGRQFTETITGVVKDFNFQSLREPIHPYGITLDYNDYRYFFIHTRTADYGSLLQRLTATWQRLNPGIPFEYSFIDQDFQRTYDQDERGGRVISAFTGLTIFIACLGLFGLAAFTAEQRRKEIGIRKVLGSTVRGIVVLLSKDFLRLVAIAILIAVPLAGWAMHRWLQEFAYQVPLNVWIFVAAAVLAIAIALLTISWQAIRAALASPAGSLRAD